MTTRRAKDNKKNRRIKVARAEVIDISDEMRRSDALLGTPVKNEINIEEEANRFYRNLHKIINDGKEIEESYTLTDRLLIQWGALLTRAGPAFLARKGDSLQATVEASVLSRTIHEHNEKFNNKLRNAKQSASYAYDAAMEYLDESRENENYSVSCATLARNMDKKAAKLKLAIETGKEQASNAQSTDEQQEHNDAVGNNKHSLEMLIFKQHDLALKSDQATQKTKLFTALYVGAKASYFKYSDVMSYLEEKGTYIQRVLREYDAGLHVRNAALMKKCVESCNAVQQGLAELNKRYMNMSPGIPKEQMPFSEMDELFKRSLEKNKELEKQT